MSEQDTIDSIINDLTAVAARIDLLPARPSYVEAMRCILDGRYALKQYAQQLDRSWSLHRAAQIEACRQG
jgi:hypothetical protein